MAAKEFRINNLARRELHAERCILALSPSLSLYTRRRKTRSRSQSTRKLSLEKIRFFSKRNRFPRNSSSSSSNFDLRTAYSILFDANMRERKAVVVTILLKFLPFPAMRARSKLHYLEASRRNNNRDRESPRFFSTPRIGGAA